MKNVEKQNTKIKKMKKKTEKKPKRNRETTAKTN